jgi:hypothetical protein
MTVRMVTRDTAIKVTESLEQFFDAEIGRMRAERAAQALQRDVQVETRGRKWLDALEQARQLRLRLRSDPRVAFFGFSQNDAEITAKIIHPAGRGHVYFVVSRELPEAGAGPQLAVFCLRQIGQPDAPFDDPMEALRELARRIAALLA